MPSFRLLILIFIAVILASCGGGGGSTTTSDRDGDGDGVPNSQDAFPDNALESSDLDGDGLGDNSDTDIDGDGTLNTEDMFPRDATEQVDLDGDGIGDNADPDRDGDGVDNDVDVFPEDAAESSDLDGDGFGDNSDTDVDGDGVENDVDLFPTDASEWADTDQDGVGDNSDVYPLHDACALSAEGNGVECYATWLGKQGVDNLDIISIGGDRWIIFVETSQIAVLFDNNANSYAETDTLNIPEDSINELVFSAAHQRVYVGYESGNIGYLDTLTLAVNLDFASTAEAVDGLAAVGNFLLAQDNSGAWESHYIFNEQGIQTDWVEWNHYSSVYAWNDALDRVYFFRDTSNPNDLLYEYINQATGTIDSDGETPYHGDYRYNPPIIVSPDESQVLVGSGDIYNAESLVHEGAVGLGFDFAAWLDDGGFILLTQQVGSFSLVRTSSEKQIIEALEIEGDLVGIYPSSTPDTYSILYFEDATLRTLSYLVSNDIDGDGVVNVEDDFPADIAASVDSDRDGFPDEWNSGFSEADSTSGLVIDAFPSDSACNLSEHGVEGVCDVNSRVSPDSITQVSELGGVIYMLSPANKAVYLWDIASQTYLNPILLLAGGYGSPESLGVLNETELYVGYSTGALFKYAHGGVNESEIVDLFSEAIQQILVAGSNKILITKYGYDTRYIALDSSDQVTETYDSWDRQIAYKYTATGNFYRLEGSSWQYINTVQFNDEGLVSNTLSHSLGNGLDAQFIAVSPDESLVVAGAAVVSDFLDGDARFTFKLPGSNEVEFTDFAWTSNIGVALTQGVEHDSLVGYSSDLSDAVFEYELSESRYEKILPYENGIVAFRSLSRGVTIEVVPLLVDSDKDGLPYWWELQHGLNDQNSSDASLDSDDDGLSNTEEFIAGTSPFLEDTDADGLSDDEELNTYSLNPLLSDTDGDSMPDSWEVEYGLDGAYASDALFDADNDGVENLYEFLLETDPQDETSFPEIVSDIAISFENSEIPSDWVLTGDVGQVSLSSSESLVGDRSLYIGSDLEISWAKYFVPVDLSISVLTNCYSSYDKEVSISVNGEILTTIWPSQLDWEEMNLTLPSGYHDIRIVVESSDASCGVFLDAIRISPLRNIFDSGVSNVSVRDSRYLDFVDLDGDVIRVIEIPRINNYWDARDAVVMDDGKIAVFNGTFEPRLSVYTPERNEWRHIQAPAWSTVNNSSYGGIGAIGSKVYATNMATSGSSTQGIVVFDLEDDSVSYTESFALIDLNIGLDGYIYGLSGSSLHVYDPASMSVVDTLIVDDSRSVAVSESGELFLGAWSGEIIHYSSSAVEQKRLNALGSVYDIDLRANGDIYISNSSGEVFKTSEDFVSTEQLSFDADFIALVPDLDSDSDGLPDWWEGGSDLNRNDSADASSDNDEDGLTALQEYAARTSATIADSDNDGLSDGDEVFTHGSDPLNADSDSDGLFDGEEVALGTSVVINDTDDDGLTDFDELQTHLTDPLLSDSDADLMEDGYEVEYSLDPLADDASDDKDEDGLSNLEEHDAGSNPGLSDTDGDGLSDYDEIIIHLSSPVSADTDSDLIHDQWEAENGLDLNDPTDAELDWDSDQFTNLEEFYAGTDPNMGSNYPLPIEWGTYQGDSSHTGYTPLILDELDFVFDWQVSFDGATTLSPAVASESQVFVSNLSHYGDYQSVFAVDAFTGDTEWFLNYPDINSINAPAYSDGQVYFQTGGHEDSFIRSVDAASGELNFESSYGNQWSSYLAPTIHDGDVYIAGGYYGGTYGFDGVSGAQLWFNSGPQYDDFTPAVDDQYVYAFTTHLKVIDKLTGELAFAVEFPDLNWGGYSVGVATVLTQSKNVVVTQSGSLVLFDTNNREISWQHLSSGFHGQPSSSDGKIFVLANNSLYSIDEASGETDWIWSARSLTSNIVVTKTHIFVGDDASTYAINRVTRDIDWTYEAAGQLSISSAGKLYISGSALTSISLQ
ncbi:PQQ-binding-like beta-propeller repeat protein [Teredinibacter waterburyi]|uniref:outer membrane protein assembly factor BamB family protein n=1 Tax=Teredinibacter waterburyi TaxID=1500538 RepID=UPI00165F03B3|nr:PQQ-binding-like beta-propeller repeat protein [Teredinibacter waterburyi]